MNGVIGTSAVSHVAGQHITATGTARDRSTAGLTAPDLR